MNHAEFHPLLDNNITLEKVSVMDGTNETTTEWTTTGDAIEPSSPYDNEIKNCK